MNTIKLFRFFMLLLIGGFLSNCASLTGFQDGRTTGKDNGEITASLNMSRSPKLKDIDDDGTIGAFPSIEAAFRYGVAEKIDVGIRVNTFGNIGVSGKFQLVGDRSSRFALATGAEVGIFGLGGSLVNVQVPLYLSIHPSEKLTFYVNPKYIYQFSTYPGANEVSGIQYYGSNLGVAFGRRNKFGIDLGFYRFDPTGVDDAGATLFQIGFGGRFPIGHNEAEDGEPTKKTKKKPRKNK